MEKKMQSDPKQAPSTDQASGNRKASTPSFEDAGISTISHYCILKKLGSGGMGEVFLAEDQVLGRKVAIKVLKPCPGDEDAHRRLLNEAKVASTLDHPNICAIHEVGEEDNRAFLVMQYVEGVTLREKMRGGLMDLRQFLDISVQITDALAEAHAKGVVHRDIKPQNIMIAGQNRVKVLDFGLAKRLPCSDADTDSGRTPSLQSQPGIVVGTIAYMSPEQTKAAAIDARSDIFSVGTLLYEMLSGHHPFKRDNSSETIAAIQLVEPAPLSQIACIPPRLEWIVDKCLRKDKEERYSSARELSLDLKRIRQDLDSNLQKAGGSSARRRILLACGIAGILMILAFAIWRLYFPPGSAPGSVVVLPFSNESGVPDGDPYCRGIAELTTSILSENPNIRVRPSLPENQSRDPGKVGLDLRVAAVLHGKLLARSNGVCTFWAGVFDVAENRYRPAKNFTIACTNILLTQKEVAIRITEMLRLDANPAQQIRMQKRSPVNDKAWHSYLNGIQAFKERSAIGIEEAINQFSDSIRSDPRFAPAYAGLANAYALKVWPKEKCIPAAISAAQTALSLDESLGEAHAAMAFIRGHYEWKWQEADRGFRRALELNPNYPTGYLWYADLLMAQGRNSEAKARLEQARGIDPGDAIIQADMVLLHFYGRNADLAIEEGLRTVNAYPSAWFVRLYLAKAYLLKGDYGEAIAALNQAQELVGATQSLAAHLVYAHGLAGHLKEAEGFFQSLESSLRQSYASPYYLAIAQIGRRDEKKALQYLEEGVRDHDPHLMYMKVDPLLDSLRGSPRFLSLLQQLQLTEK
jgi:serine/threonine protein kinase/Flp pilus assembly protein TadD